MDLDIGSLIYILITVIAIIGGVAGKKKKPQGPGTQSSKSGLLGKLETQLQGFSQQAKSSLENMKQESVEEDMEYEGFEEEEEYAEEKNYFEEVDVESEPDYKEAESSFASFEGLYSPDDEQNEALIESEGISTTDDMELSNTSEDYVWGVEQQEELENFDLRAAVIYSTIINRIEI